MTPFGLHHPGRGTGGGLVDIEAGDMSALARSEEANGAPVAHGSVGIR
jgi:hypothetical protein